jgi:hypothetical protein
MSPKGHVLAIRGSQTAKVGLDCMQRDGANGHTIDEEAEVEPPQLTLRPETMSTSAQCPLTACH